MSKPKQWVLADQNEKFRVFRYEAPEVAESGLWVEVRWSIKRELYTAFRSNAVDDGVSWVPLARPIRHHAVAKRQAFEAIAWSCVPMATVHKAESV
jgi:hypothetical protein